MNTSYIGAFRVGALVNRCLSFCLLSLTFSLPVFAETDDESLKSGAVVNYAELLRRQNNMPDGAERLRAGGELRALYVMKRHEEAFAHLRERRSEEEIERAFDLIHSVHRRPQFFFWLTLCYFPEILAATYLDFMWAEKQSDLGPEFISGGPGHYAPNPEMMELTIALTNGRIGEFEMVDVLPSGLTKADAVERGLARRRAHARELHETALAKVREQSSEQEIEAAYVALSSRRGDFALRAWINFCYLRNTPGVQADRRISSFDVDELGPDFAVEHDGQVQPNPKMIEYTLALTNGDLDHLQLVDELPSGKTGVEVVREAKARLPRDVIFHIRTLTGPLNRRDASAGPLETDLREINPKFNVVSFDARTLADLARDLRAWLSDNGGRVGMIVIEGDGLGTVTDLTSWSSRPALADGLAPLRGRLAEDAQIVAATNATAARAESLLAASQMLLEDLGATRGSVFAMTSRRQHLPPFYTRYLAGARVALASSVANIMAAVFSGVTEPSHVLFAGLGAPLLYLAARPFYATAKDRRLVKDHRLDGVVALGAGAVVLAAQAALAGEPNVVIPSVGLGGLAYLSGSIAQYLAVTAPRIWRSYRGQLNAGMLFTPEEGGTTGVLRVDRNKESVFTCQSSLGPSARVPSASFSIVR